MGSVIVTWSGQCRSDVQRETFLSFASVLADQNMRYWADYPEPISEFNRVLHATRSQGLPRLPDLRVYGEDIVGPIVVHTNVLDDASARPERAPVIDRFAAAGLPVMQESGQSAHGLITLPHARLEGIDFRLFDPRGLYPLNDRLSFVFLRAPDHPLLDNVLVGVHDAETCRQSPHPAINAASWYLEAPTIHLRYAHEAFLDAYMSWARHFFMPQLRYWRHEAFPGHAEMHAFFDELMRERGIESARDAVFDYLLHLFREEADRWIAAAKNDFRQ